MRYFAKIDLEQLSLDASPYFLHKSSTTFVKNAGQNNIPIDTMGFLSSGRVIPLLDRYWRIVNHDPLYSDLELDYDQRKYLAKRAGAICAEIDQIQAKDPITLSLKLAFYIDVLKAMQPRLGRNELSYLYIDLEQNFDKTLQQLKAIPAPALDVATTTQANNMLFSFAKGTKITTKVFAPLMKCKL